MTIRINGKLVQGSDTDASNSYGYTYWPGTKVLFVNYVESTYRFTFA